MLFSFIVPAELKDFIEQDVSRQYPNVFQGGTNLWPRVILLEASGELLGAFDQNLRQYALRRLHKSGNCEVRLGTAVERVDPGVITVKVRTNQLLLEERGKGRLSVLLWQKETSGCAVVISYP